MHALDDFTLLHIEMLGSDWKEVTLKPAKSFKEKVEWPIALPTRQLGDSQHDLPVP